MATFWQGFKAEGEAVRTEPARCPYCARDSLLGEWLAARRRDVYEQRKAGRQFKDIARAIGVSTSRARQIFLKAERDIRREQDRQRQEWQPKVTSGPMLPDETDDWQVWTPQMQAAEFAHAAVEE